WHNFRSKVNSHEISINNSTNVHDRRYAKISIKTSNNPLIVRVSMLQLLGSSSDREYKPTQFLRTQEYIPERWLWGNTEFPSAKEAHPFAYMPFGFGPRTSIGRRFAEMELETLLLTVRKLARSAGNSIPRGIQSLG
ncbi:putative cytochrome P450 12b2, mitochondrial, partial [Cyphomyrmex costatus]